MRTFMMVALFGSWVLAACQDANAGAQDDPAVRIDTVAGVPHVLNTGDGAWTQDEAWRVDSARAVVIGTLEGADEYVFGQLAGVAVAEDGRIHVADMQASEIRTYSPDGEFIARIGRDGEGPGEFRNISGLGLAPEGGIAALDARLARVTVFDSSGGYRRSFRIQRPYTIITPGSTVRFDSAGRFYDLTTLSHSAGIDSIAVVRYSAEGVLEDTAMAAVHEPERFEYREDGVLRMSFTIPFSARPSTAVGPRGLVYATDGGSYEIVQMTPAGDTLRVIERDVVPPAVTSQEREEAISELRRRYVDATGVEPRDLPTLPERRPAINALRVDETGHLWVLRPASDGYAWDVFDPEGRYLGAVSLPPMMVMHIGRNSIAGVTRDEMGVQRVRVMPLIRNPSG